MLISSKIKLLLSIAIGVINCQSNDAYTYLNTQRKLKLYEAPITIQNKNYPSNAPARLQQFWSFKSFRWLKIQLDCKEFQIPESQPCNRTYLETNDGTNRQKYCGELHLFLTSRANSLNITFRSDNLNPGGVFKCKVSSLIPEPLTIAHIPPPPSSLSIRGKSTFKFRAFEDNSSEHGMKSGRKSTTCECGKANKSPARIIGGGFATSNEYPFMAALVVKEIGMPFCGATIITSYHAITAAHCTVQITKLKIKVILNVSEHSNTGESQVADGYNVKQILQHKDYNKDAIINDISILVVDRKIKFSTYVGKVCLPTRKLDLIDQHVKILAWDKPKTRQEISTVLREVAALVTPLENCTEVWGSLLPDNNTQHLCTYDKGLLSVCKGDSGGPVLWLDPETNRYTLVGLTSYGLSCIPTNPSVKTELAPYLTWINQQIKSSSPGRPDTCTKESDFRINNNMP